MASATPATRPTRVEASRDGFTPSARAIEATRYGAQATNIICSRWPKCSLGSTVNRNSRTGGSSASVSAWSAEGTRWISRRHAQKEANMPATTQAVNQNVTVPGSSFAVRTGNPCTMKVSGRFSSRTST